MTTLLETSKWWAAERGTVDAIVTPSDRVTHAELDGWADALAEGLIADGLQFQDRVTILGTNSLEWCVAAQAVMRAGAILAPVNPRFTLSEADYMVGRFQPTVLFYDAARQALAEELAAKYPKVRLKKLQDVFEFRQRRAVNPPDHLAIDADTRIVIIATSGSTARPKGVVYSHRSMMSYIMEFSLAEPHAVVRAKILLFAPLCTSGGYVVLTQYLAYGATVFVDDTFDPARALKRIKEDRITAMMGAPVFFERIAACEGFAEVDMSEVQWTSVGGARVPRQLMDIYRQKGALLRQIYGQTEAGGQVTINTPAAAVSHPEKCGRGLPFTRLAIMDAEGNFCPPDTPGEIVIKGPGIMVEYWDDPATTAKTIVDGWLHTGDLGVIDKEGLLTMLDRMKDIIISGGLNISAAELERVIAEFPHVDEVAVIAANDEKFGETPLAVIYSAAGIDVAELIEHCNRELSNFKVPRYVALEKAPLPRLATGKIAKPVLRANYADAHVRLTRVR